MEKEIYKDYKEDRYSDIVSSVLMVVTIIPLLTNFFGSIASFYGISTSYITYLIYAVVILYEYSSLLKISIDRFLHVILCQVGIGFFLVLNYIFFEQSHKYFKASIVEVLLGVIVFVPAGLNMVYIKDYIPFFKKMKFSAIVTPIAGLLSYYTFNISSIMNYMVFSTMILPGTLACYYFIANSCVKNKFMYILIYAVDIYLLLIFGGRMAILSAFAFPLLMEYQKIKDLSTKKKFVICGVIIVAFFLLIFGWDKINASITNALMPYRNESRIIQTFVDGNFLTSNEENGRSTIYGYAKRYLETMGFRINGLFGDRIVLSKYMPTSGYVTNYAHNFYYEILLSFGWIFGLFIDIFITVKIIKNLLFEKGTSYNFVAYYFCLQFMRLLVSGSFLIEGVSILFFCSLFIKNKKKEKVDENGKNIGFD